MRIMEELNIGTIYQDIAFYIFLCLLVMINFDLLKYSSNNKNISSPIPNQ